MKVFSPAYYDQFCCLAGACPDSCCHQWEVSVDEATARMYRGLPGLLGDRLRQVLRDTEDGIVMTIENDRCPMWQQDGLCRIQTELGHEALCQVCRDFPRLRHDYGSFLELGLELSCPEAARLILSGISEMRCEEVPGGELPEYDTETMDILRCSRKTALTFLKTTHYSIPQALTVLLMYGYEVQNWLDGGEPAVLDAGVCLVDSARYAEAGDVREIFNFFRELEILTSGWKDRLEAVPEMGLWPEEIKAMAGYGIQRYWLQAVSDYDLVCRVKFIVISCLLINALGGDVLETAQLYSKEIENNIDNVEAILDGAYTSPAFTDAKLLGLLTLENP